MPGPSQSSSHAKIDASFAVYQRFDEAVKAYERRLGQLVEARGGVRVTFKFSPDHFQWLALCQCGNLSLDAILQRTSYSTDRTTISKGIHSAASLAAMAVRADRGKLKKP